jgi:hypothetical protein
MRAGLILLMLMMTMWVAAVAPIDAVDGLEVSFADGRVTIIADQVPLRAILDEWSKLGDTEFVNSDADTGSLQLAAQPLQIQLVDVPEADALRILLRDVAGFIAAPRPGPLAGTSQYGRVLVMATSRPQAGSAFVPASGRPGLPTAQRGPRVAVPTDGLGAPQGASADQAMEALRRILPQPLDPAQTNQPPASRPQPNADAGTASRPGMPVATTDESAPVFIRRPVRQPDDR